MLYDHLFRYTIYLEREPPWRSNG